MRALSRRFGLAARLPPNTVQRGVDLAMGPAPRETTLILRPLVLLMDEPFAALDEITRFKLDDDILALQGELGTTIVFVTPFRERLSFDPDRSAGRAGPRRRGDYNRPPLPRGGDFRTSSVYAHYCAQTSAALQDGMGEDLT